MVVIEVLITSNSVICKMLSHLRSLLYLVVVNAISRKMCHEIDKIYLKLSDLSNDA